MRPPINRLPPLLVPSCQEQLLEFSPCFLTASKKWREETRHSHSWPSCYPWGLGWYLLAMRKDARFLERGRNNL